MVVGGRMVVEGEDVRSRMNGNPGGQEEESRGADFLDVWSPGTLLLWSFSKGR